MPKKSPSTIQEKIASKGGGYYSEVMPELEKISTGITVLDEMLDGGIPKHKMAEFYGSEGGGKSAIAMSIAAQAQKLGLVVWLDLEAAFNAAVASKSGIDLDTLLYVGPSSAEDTLDTVEAALDSTDTALIVVDSVAGMVPQAELEGDFGDAHVGLQARLLSQAMRKLTKKVAASNATVIWINQIRDKIGVMGFGEKTTTPGGRALKFYSSTRLQVTRVGMVKQGDEIIGHKVKVRASKSRFSPQFREAEFEIHYETGISNGAHLVEMAINSGLWDFNPKGGWITDTETGEKMQGKTNVAHQLDIDPNMAKELADRLTTIREL